MALPVAKAAAALASPKMLEKILIGILGALILFITLFTSCTVQTNQVEGEKYAILFASDVKELQAMFDNNGKIDAPLLFAVYHHYFAERNDYGSIKDDLLSCFVSGDGLSPLTDREQIFSNLESVFGITIDGITKKNLIELAEMMPATIADDRKILTRHLVQSSLEEKNNISLVNFAYNALEAESGYIHGAYGQDVTLNFLLKQQAMFKGDESGNMTDEDVQFILDGYAGKPSFDCIGLIKAYEWIEEDTGDILYGSNGFKDVGADGMFKAATTRGEIAIMPDIPGIGVYMDGHIGVYIGEGEVIQAKGKRYGVVKTQLTDTAWTHWIYFPGIRYVNAGDYILGNHRVRIEKGKIIEILSNVVAGNGDFAWPLPSPFDKSYITSGSQGRYNPVTDEWQNSHGAIDIGADEGTPIYAAADGTVVMSGWHDSYGNFVKIDHGNGWATLYAHQLRRNCYAGDYITTGQIIGYVGSTGNSTGNHLHFEIRENDVRLDPSSFFE